MLERVALLSGQGEVTVSEQRSSPLLGRDVSARELKVCFALLVLPFGVLSRSGDSQRISLIAAPRSLRG